MKIQNLRFFVAVVDEGGVVKAAERLHVSQPAVSAGLKALERELGQPLFERTGNGRRLRPTSKAVAFHRNALAILQQCDEARSHFRRSEPRARWLRIGVLQTLASGEIATFLATLEERDPDLRVQVWEAGAIELGQWLRQGRIDAAWTLVERDTAHARMLWQEAFVLLASRLHRLGKPRAKVSLADLEGEAIVLRTACEMRRGQLWPDNMRMRVAARAHRDELALQLVAQGVGIAIAPLGLATAEVVAKPIHDLDANRSIGVKWRADLGEDIVSAVLAVLSSVKRGKNLRKGRGGLVNAA